MKNNIFKMTILAAAVAGLSACGGSSDNDDPTPEATKGIIISDPAVNCQSVMVGTDVATQVAPGQYTIQATATGPLKATDCVDSVSGANIGDMSSDADFNDNDSGNEIVTPVTTLVEQIKSTGKTDAEARTIASTTLGVPEGDLDKQPTESLALQKAAAKVVNIVQLVSDQGGDAADALSKVATKLADDNNTQTLAEALQDDTVLDDVLSSVPEEKKAIVKTATKSSTAAVESATTTAQAVAINKVVKDTISTGITSGSITEENISTVGQAELDNSANIAAEIEDQVVVVTPPPVVEPVSGAETP